MNEKPAGLSPSGVIYPTQPFQFITKLKGGGGGSIDTLRERTRNLLGLMSV